MINLVLSIISSICIFVILVQMVKLNIPLGLHDYYKKYSYNAMTIDFIRITIVLLLVVIIFKLIESTIFVVFIIILLSVLFGVDILLVQFLEYCKDSEIAQDLVKNAGKFGSKIILQDVIIMACSILLSIIYNIFGIPISSIITLLLIGISIIQLK
tara:strand:- start:77 stop:544 length:468 start_codon:yes stop_codon:yes gene_type:complete